MRALLLCLSTLLLPGLLAGQPPGAVQVKTETVCEVMVYSGNTDPFWGYHQPIVARAGEKVYAGILEPWGEGFQQRWGLYERSERGWRRVYASSKDQKLNQPPLLLADGRGKLHAFFWPEGTCAHLQFDLSGNLETPVQASPDVGYNDLWPYAGGGVNARGDLLVITSPYPEHRSALYEAGAGKWTRGTAVAHAPRPESPSQYDRHCYPFVALRGREAHVFSTQDVADPEKIARGDSFTYSFRKLDYYYSPDAGNAPFRAVSVLNLDGTKGWAHNDDLLLDRSGRVHLLYWYQTEERNWRTDSPQMHAFGPPGGPLTHVKLGQGFVEGRFWEAPDGALYVVWPRRDDLYLGRLTEDGTLAGAPAPLGVGQGREISGPRVFLAPARAMASGAPVLEGLYRVSAGSGKYEVRYFQVTFRPTPDFNGDGVVGYDDFFLFADAFGKKGGQAGFSAKFDLDGDGEIGFGDFFAFAAEFGKRVG
jgi:hypothetical protein